MSNKYSKIILVQLLLLISCCSFGHGPDTHSSARNLPVGVEEFPTLHPLIVHFPIILLLVAACLQVIALFSDNKLLHHIITAMIGVGLVTAYISSSFVHPHTVPLSTSATEVLQTHERYASITLWLSGLSFASKIFSLLSKKRVFQYITATILIGAAVTVSIAGHHGAELVHKYGIGPKGNYLENHKH